MSKTKTKSKKKKKAKSVKAKKAVKRTDRTEASVIVLNSICSTAKSITIDKAIRKADEVYVKAGGNSNLKESRYSFNHASKVFVLLKMVEIKDGQISRTK